MQTFQETGLGLEILNAVNELGFEKPTPIQEKAIPYILSSNNDLIALAQTGTGKTAAFGLPLIQLADPQFDKVQALVLCPTRELCMQITNDLENYSKYINNFSVVSVYGGANIVNQIKALRTRVQVVVGTPGRLLDLIRRRALKINNIKWLVLDEADEMLNMGFKEDLDTILAETPQEKQTLLFSATMPNEIMKMVATYMKQPLEISVGKRNSGAENVSHEYYMIQAKDRYNALKRIADINPDIYGIVFCRTRQETKDVADKLINDGYNADALHGDLSQAQRDNVMSRFRFKHLQILVATDVAARGLDLNNLSHVINYNLPDDPEVYIHRSGRTGRAGKNGISISIIHTRESKKIFELERLSGKKFQRKMVPSGKEICEKQLLNLVDKVEKVAVNDSHIEQFLPLIYEKLDWLNREELIKHFVSVEFNRFLSYYKNAPDLNVKQDNSRQDRLRQDNSKKRKKSRVHFSRFYINLGSKNNLNAAGLIEIINKKTRIKNIEIGKINIMKKFSFFEIDSSFEKDHQSVFKNETYDGKPLVVQLSKPDPNPRFRPKKEFTEDNRKKLVVARKRKSS